ncbi:MAG: hypothetical protein FWB80_07655 [Defluviitaleaceae bacterium]|nr:hypothetical protein [Defluviitaleaceae bacterium]
MRGYTGTQKPTRQPVPATRPYNPEDVIRSERGFYFIRSELMVLGGFGMNFNRMVSYMDDRGGEIDKIYNNPAMYAS